MCVCVCESVSALSTSKGNRGWAAQDLLGATAMAVLLVLLAAQIGVGAIL